MTDTQTAPAKRAKVSERLLFDAAGAECGFSDAVKAVYKVLPIGRAIEIDLDPTLPTHIRALAAFGFHTKIGNVANTVRNEKDAAGNPVGGTPEDEADAAESWFESLVNDGQWREASEAGPRGPKYDDAILADVIVAALGDKAKGDAAYYLAKLTDKDGPDKGYRQKVLAAAMGGVTVKDLYAAEAERRGVAKPAAQPKALDDLA